MIEKWPLVLAAVSVTCLGCGLLFFLSRGMDKEKTPPRWSIWLLGLFFVISVILRLAFLTETFVPPYFDSVEHYRLVKELVTAMGSSTLLKTIPSLTPNYYHLGFHLLAAFLTFGLHANPINMILVLGQVILAAMPIPLFFLIRNVTQNNVSAFFGVLLAGFGWYMPGFAVNWGKYPALSGLLTLELVLGVAYFVSLRKTKRNRILLIGWLILGTLISTLFHSRTLIVIVFTIISWLVADRLQNWSIVFRYALLAFALVGILILGVFVWQNPLLKLALEPYLVDGIWVTLVVVFSSPFAFRKFPRGVYFSIFLTLLVFIAMFISVGSLLPGFEDQTLLDRPFVEMLLYLPLSLLGGLGLAGFLQFLNEIKGLAEGSRRYVRILAAFLFLGFAVLVPLRSYDFSPSDCCNFVKYDDTIAFDWLDENLPPDANILIAATRMNVLPSGPAAGLTGSDAGIWITALTGKRTTPLPYDIDFRSEDTLNQLCQQKIDYIYVGSTDQKFDISQLLSKGNWYKAVLALPDTQVYRVVGCSG